LIFRYFFKFVDQIEVSLKCGQNDGTVHEDRYTVYGRV